MDFKFKPLYLPQISAPFSIVFNELKNRDIGYKLVDSNISDITPSQGIVFSDKINSIESDNIKAIFLSKENKLLDGHHRYGSAISNGKDKIKSVVINLPFNDAIRILNQIQDLYDYELKLKNDIESNKKNNFLSFINDSVGKKINNAKKKKITGYRQTPINKNSKIGNFFMLAKDENNSLVEYSIEFESLLDTDDLGIIFKKSKSPVETLCDLWFPNIDFNKLSSEFGVDKNLLLNRAVAEKAMKLGYDGIKYGDILLHGLK